ncbi:MAG TPA: nuclear transport factor 2 family protein [Gemmatimonadaceae bacterium]|nr:nuclear transport factor 2 family protein [Gemmatimonadaceae bacterium]
MRIATTALAFAVLTTSVSRASCQSAADSAAIRATALDYIDGWYAADGTRMERALHPELAKRIVRSDSLGHYRLDTQSAMTLVQNTRAEGGKQTPMADRRDDVRILDIFQNAASVRVDASYWVDYLQMARWRGRWVIVNVLWELKPKS